MDRNQFGGYFFHRSLRSVKYHLSYTLFDILIIIYCHFIILRIMILSISFELDNIIWVFLSTQKVKTKLLFQYN
jgi:hypothetical protein